MNPESIPIPSIRDETAHFPKVRLQTALYAPALTLAISLWLIAIRAPLFLDETFSYWQIKAGIRNIFSRRGSLSPLYPYLLWFFTRITGTSEIGLRLPSVLAMLAAVFVLYRAARELFGQDVALTTAAVFCIHPIVAYSAIDARPYAFAALAVNSAILLLVRLRNSNSDLLAACYGASVALISYFHLVFGAIFPVLAICFLLAKLRQGKTLARQFGIALLAFFLVFLPNIPDLLFIFHARQTLVFDKPSPKLVELVAILAPGYILLVLMAAALIAAATRRIDLNPPQDGWPVLVSTSLGIIPLIILFGISATTSTNVFVERYCLVAIPGIALTWGFIASRFDSRKIRLLFCVAMVVAAAYGSFRSPISRVHGYTWKYALEVAQNNASVDNAPVLICSDFPNADYVAMPSSAEVKDSGLFTPLSYYPLSVPVVGLPRALNQEAVRIGSDFVLRAATHRQRFLVLAFGPSYNTMGWLTNIAAENYEVRPISDRDGVIVLEFDPYGSGSPDAVTTGGRTQLLADPGR